jgi:hypothetical protein
MQFLEAPEKVFSAPLTSGLPHNRDEPPHHSCDVRGSRKIALVNTKAIKSYSHLKRKGRRLAALPADLR